MAYRFLSREWATETRRVLGKSPLFSKAIHGLSSTLLARVTHTPHGKDQFLYFEFADGKLSKLDVGTHDSIAKKEPEFTIEGAYEAFEKLYRGTLSVQAAYFRRQVTIHGNLVHAVRFAPAFVKYNEVARQVETLF